MLAIGIFVVLIGAVIGIICARDAVLQRRMVGTWADDNYFTNSARVTGLTVIDREGRYDQLLTNYYDGRVTRIFRLQGMNEIWMGRIVDTVTNRYWLFGDAGDYSSRKPVESHIVGAYRIVRLNDRELAIKGADNQVVVSHRMWSAVTNENFAADLLGMWRYEGTNYGGYQSLTYLPGGTFTLKWTTTDGVKTSTNEMSGTFVLNGRSLIETAEKHSDPDVPLPRVFHSEILEMLPNRAVMRIVDGNTNTNNVEILNRIGP